MVVICSVCGKEYSKTNNLNRHFREKHGEIDEDFRNESGNKFQCTCCAKLFKRKENLQIHLNTVHFQKEKEHCPLCSYATANHQSLVRHTKTVHKNSKSKSSEEKNYLRSICHFCSKDFKHKRHLHDHLRSNHNFPSSLKIVKKNCPLCSFTATHQFGSTVNDLIFEHFKEIHSLSMYVDNMEFDNISEFNSWKSEMEKRTDSKFNKSNRQAVKCLRFTCHRSGTFKSRGSGKRHLRMIGSCKINGFCPAAITAVVQSSGKIKVSFLKTHVGHKNDLEHIFLTSEERQNIASKLACNMSSKEILRDITESLSDDEIKRVHLTTYKDILNIKSSFKKYMGSYIDKGIRKDMCKHKHIVSRHKGDSDDGLLDVDRDSDDSLVDADRDSEYDLLDADEDSEDGLLDEDEDMAIDVETVQEEEAIFKCSVTMEEEKSSKTFQEAKENFVQTLTQVFMNRITNFEELKAIQDHCESIVPILDSMKASSSVQSEQADE